MYLTEDLAGEELCFIMVCDGLYTLKGFNLYRKKVQVMFKKVFFKMSVAQIISSMTVILCLLIDSIMIGRFLGVNSMAAYGLANPFLLVFAGIGTMLSAGAQVMSSKALGSGNQDDANAFFTITITLCIGVSIIGVLLIGLFSGPVAGLLGADVQANPELFTLTRAYLIGFIIGVPAFLSATVLVPFLQLVGKQKVLIISVLVMIVCDVIFDLLNVFVFEGGMFGMGLASSLSYYVACFFGLSYFLSKKCIFKFRLKLIKKDKILGMLKAGVPTIINMFSLVLLSFTLNQILLTLGKPEESVAAYSIISTASNVCYCFSTGIATVTLTLAGVYYYENDKHTLIALLKSTMKAIMIVDVAVVALVLLTSPYIVKVFMQEGQQSAEALATVGLRIFVISIIPSGITAGLKNFYQGTSRIKMTCVISVLQNFLFIAGCSFLLSRFLGTTGVWMGYICGETIVLLGISLYVFRRTGGVAVKAEKFSLLDPDYGVSDEHFFRAELTSIGEVTGISDRSYQFCKELGTGNSVAYFTALTIEEICNNIYTYGYLGHKDEKSVEVSLFYDSPKLVIRICDAATPFNPKEYLEMVNSEDRISHMGIRMAFSTANEVKYSNSLSQNTLTITMDSSTYRKAIKEKKSL